MRPKWASLNLVLALKVTLVVATSRELSRPPKAPFHEHDVVKLRFSSPYLT